MTWAAPLSPLSPLSPLWGEWLRAALEACASLAFALSGVVAAARRRLDPVGVCVVGFAAAFGGGTLRDLLLDQRPFFWVRHIEFLWALLIVCTIAVALLRQRHLELTERAILLPDAVGLGLFTAVGVDLSLALGQPALAALLMGVVTSAFGGVLRDLLCNELPRALSDHRPYALCAFGGGWLYVALLALALPPWLALTTTVVTTAGVRLLAVRRDWQLPGWRG